MRTAIFDAIDVADSVHTVAGLKPISILCAPLDRAHGQIIYPKGVPLAIEMDTNDFTPRYTLLHEIAHVIDADVFDGGMRIVSPLSTSSTPLSSVTSDAMRQRGIGPVAESLEWVRPWLVRLERFFQTLMDTELVMEIQEIGDNDVDWMLYMLQGDELFARAYVQWIALSSGDRRLSDELEQVRDRSPFEVWDDADFEPVARELDTLLSPRIDTRWSSLTGDARRRFEREYTRTILPAVRKKCFEAHTTGDGEDSVEWMVAQTDEHVDRSPRMAYKRLLRQLTATCHSL
jgi:hypothetical protein